MPTRLPSASTTFETALTIPVNIHIPRDQEIGAEPYRIQLAKWDRINQTLNTGASDGPRPLAPADESRRHVGVDFVYQPIRKEGSVYLAPAFHQQAEDAPVAQFIEQGRQGHSAVCAGRQPQDLGCP